MRRIVAPFEIALGRVETKARRWMIGVPRSEPPRRPERRGRTAKSGVRGAKDILLGVFFGVCGVLAVGLGGSLIGPGGRR